MGVSLGPFTSSNSVTILPTTLQQGSGSQPMTCLGCHFQWPGWSLHNELSENAQGLKTQLLLFSGKNHFARGYCAQETHPPPSGNDIFPQLARKTARTEGISPPFSCQSVSIFLRTFWHPFSYGEPKLPCCPGPYNHSPSIPNAKD